MSVRGRLSGWFSKLVLAPAVRTLATGLSPGQVALALALGAVLGLSPILGSTTALCFAAALALRLNVALMQAANYLVYPLQIALIVPWLRLGEWAFQAETPLSLRPDQIRTALESRGWELLGDLGDALLYAAGAWVLAAPFLAVLLFALLLPLVRRLTPTEVVKEKRC